MTKERQMQLRKLHEQQDIKPVGKQTTDARIAAFGAKLRISSQYKEVDVKKNKG